MLRNVLHTPEGILNQFLSGEIFRMFLSSESMDRLEKEVDDIFTAVSLKERISKYYEYSTFVMKGQSEVPNNEDWSVLLTPPSSPDYSPSYEANDKQSENLTPDVEELQRVAHTKDLNSMLIRDCMWNGMSPVTGRNFEHLRPLSKTPPLVDCNLRITYVDPSEIWPFNFNEQIKAGKSAVYNNDESTDEDVEVDVVGLEGSHKVGEEKMVVNEVKKAMDENCESFSEDAKNVETTAHNENNDHDYSCKLRSGTKRRRSSNSEWDKENFGEQKTRVLSGDESDVDCDTVGRASHNVLERKRRNELKLRFQYLRDSIPDISGNDRAPKVSILQKAYSYILQLQSEEKHIMQQMRTQKNRNEQLLKKVLAMKKDSLSF